MDEAGRPGNLAESWISPARTTTPIRGRTGLPDGARVVYTAQDVDATSGNSVVRVRDFATGKDREIYRSHDSLACVWATRHAKIFL